MTLRVLDKPVLRQALVSARVADSVTGRGPAEFAAELDYDPAGAPEDWRPFPAHFRRSADGWFTFHLDPEREAPALTGIASLRLRVTVRVPGLAPVQQIRTVNAADLALETRSVQVAGRAVDLKRIKGAPFDFSLQIDPAPVALAGFVLRDNDPATPAPLASVTITDPASAVSATTDANGWFRLDALPLARSVGIRATDGARVVNQVVHPDFSKPVNETVLSVSTA